MWNVKINTQEQQNQWNVKYNYKNMDAFSFFVHNKVMTSPAAELQNLFIGKNLRKKKKKSPRPKRTNKCKHNKEFKESVSVSALCIVSGR